MSSHPATYMFADARNLISALEDDYPQVRNLLTTARDLLTAAEGVVIDGPVGERGAA